MKLSNKSLFVGLAALSVAISPLVGVAAPAPAHDSEALIRAVVAKQLPNSKITAINCDFLIPGICEVDAGKNVFYMTKEGRYLFVGQIIDFFKSVDITDERQKQIAAVDSVVGKLFGDGQASTVTQPAAQASNSAPVAPQHLAITLPAANAVVHNPGAPIKVAVFTDYNCHFCRATLTELANNKQVELTEYPIAILGDREDSHNKAKLVLCATDRAAASDIVFNPGDHRTINTIGDCKAAEEAVAQNTKFADDNHINGTPTFVRADGTVHTGYMSQADLTAFGSAKS